MIKNQNETPIWVTFVREKILKAKEDVNIIRRAGQDNIRRGLETVKGAEKQLQKLDYIENMLSQNISPSAWNDEIVMATGMQLGGTISIFQNDSQRIAGFYQVHNQDEQNDHLILIDSFDKTFITTGSMTYLGAEIESRLQAIIQPYKPIWDSTKFEQIGSRKQIYFELEEVLNPFPPQYLNMLRGSEIALYNKSDDTLAQASHSMRDLFQQLIEHIAPSDVVKQQPWFKPTIGAPGELSRMSRLRYIVYGSGEFMDEHDIKRLDNAAEGAKNALDLAQARAHDHDPELTPADVELAIDFARFSLLEVLRHYERRRNQGVA